ncbi:MAG: hypothetical protein NC211_07420 [Alistipes senegalensis]|nr:hypothetical protein [Oxalobacter formigenes]MCM1281639.1 hypothetical protein [Alistipes senegalensis]
MSTGKIEDTSEAWEDGLLGRDETHIVRVPDNEQEAIDEALGLKMISIRLPADLIQAYKDISAYRGLHGYQPLMRDALKRFAEAERKLIMTEIAEDIKQKLSAKAA